MKSPLAPLALALFFALALFVAPACVAEPARPPATGPRLAALAAVPLSDQPSRLAPEPAPAREAPAPPAEPLAPSPAEPRFDSSLPTEITVAGDRLAQVAHGAVGNARAIVYLHGLCGNVHAFRPWAEAAIQLATIIAVLGDDPCDEPARFKWGADLARTDERILRAIRAVSAVRGAPLDERDVTLIGYSQGSARAERLLQKYPERYRRALLIAGPHEHVPSSFDRALAVAIIAGGKDLKAHLQDSAAKAQKAGVRAQYFKLPGAHHGEYGADAVRVMGAALAWVYAEPGTSGSFNQGGNAASP